MTTNNSRSVRLTLITRQTAVPDGGLSLFNSDETIVEDCEGMDDEFDFDDIYDVPYDFEDAALRKMEEEYESCGSDGPYEMTTSAEYSVEDGRAIFTYNESRLTDMEGTVTQISFDINNSGVVTILRSGAVKSAFVLEEGRRHTSAYETPLLPFEICVYGRKVKNSVVLPTSDGDLPKGEILLDYVVEIRGMDAQHTCILIKIG